MCLVAFAINASASWPLVIASNRDEFFDRPAAPLARWQTAAGQTVISGRDCRAGGTWFGVTPEARIAFLTNVRQSHAGNQVREKSRGELVLRWLESRMTAEEFMTQIKPQDYAGFNLVVGDLQTTRWTWMSNRQGRNAAGRESEGWVSLALTDGVYGLSNAALDTPWPKTTALKLVLKKSLAETPGDLEASLWTALDSRERAADAQLPHTGVPLALEQALSSAFVESPERGYGTRCSTLLVVSSEPGPDQADEQQLAVRMAEKTYASPHAGILDAGGVAHQELRWPSPQTN